MPSGFRGNHPPSETLRVFAIHLDPGDSEVQFDSVLELEFALEVDLNQSPTMGLLSLEELIPSIAACSLSVVQLVEGIAQDASGLYPGRVEPKESLGNGVELRVVPHYAHRPLGF